MSHYLFHPKYGRILSFDAWTQNCARTHCSYCGAELEKELYVTSYGMCQEHKTIFENQRHILDEIMKYRLNAYKEGFKK